MTENKKLLGILFREKPRQMLMNLYNKKNNLNYASNLAKEIDCTYSHCVKILQEYEKDGLVAFNKTGRIKELSLTKNGLEICQHIEAIVNLL